jgi:hypothetical protein
VFVTGATAFVLADASEQPCYAEMLRPVRVDDLLGDRDAQLKYRDAVHDYVTAFEVAEAEAIRRRRSDFSPEGQQRLARAQSLFRLAGDSAATTQERRQATSAHATKSMVSSCVPAAGIGTRFEDGRPREIVG